MGEINLSYEDALKELEYIIEKLERNESSLDKSIEIFKNGIELYKYCNSLLSNAEGEVKILLNDLDDCSAELNFFEVNKDNDF